MELIDQTIKAGAREKMACQELGISQRTLQRWRAAETLSGSAPGGETPHS